MSEKRTYDSTVARIAGDIASGLVDRFHDRADQDVVRRAVWLARAIVAEVQRTEPADPKATP